jgi:two-component system sensor histidine kinase DctS
MPTTPATTEASLPGGHRKRWLLWAALVVVLCALVGTAMVLARRFQENRVQAQLDQETATLVSDIRAGLGRNIQTLQTLHNAPSQRSAWDAAAADVLTRHREIVAVSWHNAALSVVTERTSPYLVNGLTPHLSSDRRQDMSTACAHARRTSSAVYAPSYFRHNGDGQGLELMEMCVPDLQQGKLAGYLVVTYSLQGILAELPDRVAVRGRGVALTELDGTRLAITSQRPLGQIVVTEQLLELPGNVMKLRLDSPRERFEISPWGATGLVAAMSALLLGLTGLLGRDMRLRQRVELALADSLAFRKAMEDSLVTGLRARDMGGHITYVNPAFCQMVGLDANELLGKGPPAPYWPPDMADEYQRRQAIRLAGQVLPREGFESVFMRPDGTCFPVLIIEAPLIDAQGTQTGWMSAILDLTEQHRIEALSRASQDRLQATARLASVGEMASLLSHELNQPLSAISSYATGALNLLTAPQASNLSTQLGDVAEAMTRIQSQADRAAKVIRSVGDFVRRREHPGELARDNVSAHSLFQAILPLLTLQASREHIRIELDTAADCPDALCDRTMIEQVLLNLARNGMQAMPAEEPPPASGLRTLTLAAQRHTLPDGKHRVRFAVTDHGAGLPDDVAANLFTPFFTTKAEGMGLGLSLCRTVVEQHGGTLTHTPAQPSGTTFCFTLPATLS